jgi:hypothetical protein
MLADGKEKFPATGLWNVKESEPRGASRTKSAPANYQVQHASTLAVPKGSATSLASMSVADPKLDPTGAQRGPGKHAHTLQSGCTAASCCPACSLRTSSMHLADVSSVCHSCVAAIHSFFAPQVLKTGTQAHQRVRRTHSGVFSAQSNELMNELRRS